MMLDGWWRRTRRCGRRESRLRLCGRSGPSGLLFSPNVFPADVKLAKDFFILTGNYLLDDANWKRQWSGSGRKDGETIQCEEEGDDQPRWPKRHFAFFCFQRYMMMMNKKLNCEWGNRGSRLGHLYSEQGSVFRMPAGWRVGRVGGERYLINHFSFQKFLKIFNYKIFSWF